MENSDKFILSFLLLLEVGVMAGMFLGGRVVERKHWEVLVPEQMEKLCYECAQIGDN